MMTCKEVIEFLMGYLDGELPPEQRRVFEKHLAVCPPCVAYLHTYQATVKAGKECCREEDCEKIPDDLVKAILAARAVEAKRTA